MAKKVDKVIDLYELGKAAQSLLLRHHGGLLPDTRHYLRMALEGAKRELAREGHSWTEVTPATLRKKKAAKSVAAAKEQVG